MRFVALLRGINVGGKSLIKMAELRACVGELGHENVHTFIASGNVLFESGERDAAKLDSALERAIEERFGFQVRVVVRSRSEVERVVARIPERWMGAQALRVTVAFLLRGNDARAIAASLSPRDGIDQVVAAPGALTRK